MLVLGLGLGLRLGRRLLEKILTHYIDTINSLSFDSDTKLADICSQMEFVPLKYLFERILAVLASLGPIERVFSKTADRLPTSRENVGQNARVIIVCVVFHLQLTGLIMSSVHGMCMSSFGCLALFFENCQFVSNNNNISIYS